MNPLIIENAALLIMGATVTLLFCFYIHSLLGKSITKGILETTIATVFSLLAAFVLILDLRACVITGNQFSPSESGFLIRRIAHSILTLGIVVGCWISYAAKGNKEPHERTVLSLSLLLNLVSLACEGVLQVNLSSNCLI